MGLNAYRLVGRVGAHRARAGPLRPGRAGHLPPQLEALHAAGIEPMVTLHHFTNPRWLAERGGLAQPGRGAALRRVRRPRRHADLGDLVRWWVTINEPSILGLKAYIEGSLAAPSAARPARLRATAAPRRAAHTPLARQALRRQPTRRAGQHGVRPLADAAAALVEPDRPGHGPRSATGCGRAACCSRTLPRARLDRRQLLQPHHRRLALAARGRVERHRASANRLRLGDLSRRACTTCCAASGATASRW